MDNRKAMLQVLGIAFIAFLAGVAITSPLALGAAPATQPPSFQVLANNLIPDGEPTVWIGGVAGYNTVTIILSWVSLIAPRTWDVGVLVCFQKGTQPLDCIQPCDDCWSFHWTHENSTLAQQYPVNGADTVIIMTDRLTMGGRVSIAILASDPVWSSANYVAVGGIVLPANTFAVLSQSLAVIGLVACIGTLVLVIFKWLIWGPRA